MPSWWKRLLERIYGKQTVPPVEPPPPTSSIPYDLLAFHNVERAKHGKAPLALNDTLVAVAQKHSDYQAEGGQLSHYGFDRSTPWDRITQAGYRYQSASENVAAGQRIPQEAVDDWLSSAGHRANVLGDFRDCGFGMSRAGSGTRYWTAVYATPARAAVEMLQGVLRG